MVIWQDEDPSAAALIRRKDGRIELLTTRRLPFQPKGVLREARDRLHLEFRRLTAGEDELFDGRYSSAITEFADAENVLFYNVGIPRCACRFGLQFARDFTKPTQVSGVPHCFVHCQSYALVSRQADCVPTSSVARIQFELPRLSTTLKAAYYWRIAKQSLIPAHVAFDNMPGPFKMKIRLCGPTYRGNIAAIVKPVFDGIISALHYDPSASPIDPGYATFATKLGVACPELINLLNDPTNAILGPRKLITSSGQLNPADERCYFGQLIIGYNQSGHWSVDAVASPCQDTFGPVT
jgi:hypothetical protein